MDLSQSANAQKDKQALKPSDVVLVDNEKACSWFPPIAGITNEARVVDIVNHELVSVRSLQGGLFSSGSDRRPCSSVYYGTVQLRSLRRKFQ